MKYPSGFLVSKHASGHIFILFINLILKHLAGYDLIYLRIYLNLHNSLSEDILNLLHAILSC